MSLFEMGPDEARFDGVTYDPKLDKERLKGQLERVYHYMKDGHWSTIDRIAIHTGASPAAVSARLRDLRKEKFGSYLVEKQRLKDSGLWIYRVGQKGEGSPERRECRNCDVLEARATFLEGVIEEIGAWAEEYNALEVIGIIKKGGLW